MKKLAILALTGTLVLAPIQASQGATFKNCTEVRKVYPGGIAKASGIKNKGGKTSRTPKVSANIYKSISKMDRDKDGIACEN